MKRFLLLLALISLFTGCTSLSVQQDPSILRVGITADSPPIIFKQGGQISGAEASFAEKLGQDLGREIVFIEVPWAKQIEYIEKNKTDIIMSGMTITQPREYRINFSKPYMIAGLTALFRRSDYAANGLMPSVVRHQSTKIGAVKNTTGEIYVLNTYVNAKVIIYNSKDAAVSALKSSKINMLIHDAPTIWWIAAKNEAELVSFPELMNNEKLAWGISKNNLELLDAVNLSLEKMKNDGSGEEILKNWFPGKSQ